ncbi:putative glycolipid-binding domain-containing protein [Massilia niastensis]|uniref:putative glycolipid-binding domain-containing protein n=1 Tax=Massilia niastensis TaxID=544911 RepID=UPI0003AA876E|nr:putative glycolipid-binding domain-containing protein [Massilia niastensis]
MQRSYRWATQQGGGCEHLALSYTDELVIAEGVVIGPASGNLFPGELFGVAYVVRCDAHWRVREVEVQVAGGASLLLGADGEGRWSGADGESIPALDGCIDVDLSCTPFTNTLPLRRLGDRLRQRQDIQVAFIELPSLALRPAHQAYTCLAPGRYRFDSPADAFTAEIETDAEGLVLRYPGLFTRIPT